MPPQKTKDVEKKYDFNEILEGASDQGPSMIKDKCG